MLCIILTCSWCVANFDRNIEDGNGVEQKEQALAAAVAEIVPQVDCFSVACNYLHGFVEVLKGGGGGGGGGRGGQFVSMTDATVRHCQRLVAGRAAGQSLVVFGGEEVMDIGGGSGASPYRALADVLGPAAVREDLLGESDVSALMAVIGAVKREGARPGVATVRTFERLLRVAEAAATPPPVVVLACTELPMLVGAVWELCAEEAREPPSLAALVDPAQLLAEALLDHCDGLSHQPCGRPAELSINK
jgi:hypothetical protein